MKGIPIALRVYRGQMVHGTVVLLTKWIFKHQMIIMTSPPSKGKGLLGLLNETNPPTIQQPLPEITTPQKNIPSTDLLSNLNDDNLITNDDKTSVPKEDSKPLNLLEEQQQESPVIEDEDANILKDENKEEAEQEQLSANEGDEIQSEEENEQEEQEESNEEEQEQQQPPPLAETLTPNTELVK